MGQRIQSLRAGALDVAPILLGVVPFGLIYGVAATEAGLGSLSAFLMSSIVFAGAAQLVIVDLLAQNAAWPVILVTALVINLRMAMYGASLAPHFAHWSPWWKRVGAYLVTDQAFAVSIIRYEKPMAELPKRWYYFGAAVALWLVWQCSTMTGIALGATIPASWELDFAVPLTFMALLVPSIKDRNSMLAALGAGVAAALTSTMIFKLGIITSALIGVLVGYFAEGSER